MARNPYGKRIAQGAAQGALGGATAGTMILPGIGTAIGAGVGGLAGGLLARPGDDERRLRARMRKLEMGVLGDEEAAIRARFMNPVTATANEQLVRQRALSSPSASVGAQARQGVVGQRAARQDIAEAGQEATLAAMDLGEQRRQQAQRINEGLLAQEGQRDRAFRQSMLAGSLDAASMIGQTKALNQLKAEEERRALGGAVGNAADIAAAAGEIQLQPGGFERAAISDEDVAALQLGGGLSSSRADLDAGMAATRAALDARPVPPPVTAETVDDYLMSRVIPVAAPSVPVPGDAMTPTLMGRGESIGSGAAVQTFDDVGTRAVDPDPFSVSPRQQQFAERRQELSSAGLDFRDFDAEDQQFIFDADEDEYKAFLTLQSLGGGLLLSKLED